MVVVMTTLSFQVTQLRSNGSESVFHMRMEEVIAGFGLRPVPDRNDGAGVVCRLAREGQCKLRPNQISNLSKRAPENQQQLCRIPVQIHDV